MNKTLFLFLFLLAAGMAFGHDHVEVDEQSGRLQLFYDPDSEIQTALFVPRGEPFSFYLPDFPGGWHASEFTFTTDRVDADPRIELVSVQGPAGGNFAFWEAGATTPTWSRAAGWSSAQGGIPTFPVVVGGEGHTHGRAFTMDKPGSYAVTFRAVETNGAAEPSAEHTFVFRAQQPPQLSISTTDGKANLEFTSRLLNTSRPLNYDLQVCTNLPSGVWTSVVLVQGDGGPKLVNDPMAGRPRAFYRLVEY
jgi:hypothetical protein